MAIKSARWTRFDLERFPEDGNRYEVLNGELLVTPQAAPDHQFVAARLSAALKNTGSSITRHAACTSGPEAAQRKS